MRFYIFTFLLLALIPLAYFGISAAHVITQLTDVPTTNLNMKHDIVRIPKIIHHVWNSTDIPAKWQNTTKSCAELHPDYKVMIWTDAEAEKFVKERFPRVYDSYMSYPYIIQKVDAIRYMILYEFGGFYLDLDIGCSKSLDSLRTAKAILPQTKPVGFSNDFMASEPQHPFFKLLIDNLPSYNHYYGTKYITVMFSTGPNFVNAVFTKFPHPQDVVVLLLDYYNGKSVESYFWHVDGNSWHGDDVLFIGFLYSHSVSLLAGFLLIGGIFLAWKIKNSLAPKRDNFLV